MEKHHGGLHVLRAGPRRIKRVARKQQLGEGLHVHVADV